MTLLSNLWLTMHNEYHTILIELSCPMACHGSKKLNIKLDLHIIDLQTLYYLILCSNIGMTQSKYAILLTCLQLEEFGVPVASWLEFQYTHRRVGHLANTQYTTRL